MMGFRHHFVDSFHCCDWYTHNSPKHIPSLLREQSPQIVWAMMDSRLLEIVNRRCAETTIHRIGPQNSSILDSLVLYKAHRVSRRMQVIEQDPSYSVSSLTSFIALRDLLIP